MKALKMVMILGSILTLFMAGCKEDNPDNTDGSEFDTNALLNNYSENIILPRYQELATQMNLLMGATNDFQNDVSAANLANLRTALLEAELAFQPCTSFEFGPASTYTLRSILNTYPTNESIINQNISSGGYNLYTAGNIAAIGFPAMEYLLYGTNLTDQEVLDLFAADAEAANRLTYLFDVVSQSQVVAGQVNTQWTSGGYHEVFVNANGTAVGSSVSLMMNSFVLDFERFIRDGKVGIPLGVRSLGTPNPEKVEAYYSEKSLALLAESMDAYKKCFNGVSSTEINGVGFDDYLIHEDAEAISHKINTQLDLIVAKQSILNGPLSEDVLSNKPDVQAVYDEMQKLIVSLKVEMPSALAVLITYQDSDGD